MRPDSTGRGRPGEAAPLKSVVGGDHYQTIPGAATAPALRTPAPAIKPPLSQRVIPQTPEDTKRWGIVSLMAVILFLALDAKTNQMRRLGEEVPDFLDWGSKSIIALLSIAAVGAASLIISNIWSIRRLSASRSEALTMASKFDKSNNKMSRIADDEREVMFAGKYKAIAGFLAFLGGAITLITQPQAGISAMVVGVICFYLTSEASLKKQETLNASLTSDTEACVSAIKASLWKREEVDNVILDNNISKELAVRLVDVYSDCFESFAAQQEAQQDTHSAIATAVPVSVLPSRAPRKFTLSATTEARAVTPEAPIFRTEVSDGGWAGRFRTEHGPAILKLFMDADMIDRVPNAFISEHAGDSAQAVIAMKNNYRPSLRA